MSSIRGCSALSKGQRVLVVGAGFAGAVYARELAEAGHSVEVIDLRSHIAGNAFDIVHETGVRYHVYGPHIFHTSISEVVNWITRFSEFVPYDHRVTIQMPDGNFAPFPINIATLNTVFGGQMKTEIEARHFVESLSMPNVSERNAAVYLYGKLGQKLTDIFFRPYSKKMWGIDLEDIEASVVKRIPIRFDLNESYFPDDMFQALPLKGYASLFSNIFDHKNIRLRLSTKFDRSMAREFSYTFNSMPIDEYFDYRFGPLPYRSIRFHHKIVGEAVDSGPTAVTNFCDNSVYTRQTDWAKFPMHRVENTCQKLITVEEPCDYKDNNFERYYPVKSTDSSISIKYDAYRELAKSEPTTLFIGRCGTYRYLDMHQVINQSLQGARKWLKAADDV